LLTIIYGVKSIFNVLKITKTIKKSLFCLMISLNSIEINNKERNKKKKGLKKRIFIELKKKEIQYLKQNKQYQQKRYY